MSHFIHPQQVEVLIQQEIQVLNPGRSSQIPLFDRFDVQIPYSKEVLKIRVVFDSMNHNRGPDLFMISPGLAGIELPKILDKWKPQDNLSLLKVLQTVKQAYSEKQKNLLDFMSESVQLLVRDIEQLTGQSEINGDFQTDIISKFTISVPLPVVLPNKKCKKPVYCHIEVYLSAKKFRMELEYPKWAEDYKHITIENIFNRRKDMCQFSQAKPMLANIIEVLEKQSDQKLNCKKIRQLFFQYVCHQGLGIPLEIDTNKFLKAQFYIEVPLKAGGLIMVQLFIELGNEFPKESPRIRFVNTKVLNRGVLNEKIIGKLNGWDRNKHVSQLATLTKEQSIRSLIDFIKRE